MTLTSDDLEARARRQDRLDPWLSLTITRLIEQQGLARKDITGGIGRPPDWLRQRLHGRIRWSLQDLADVAGALGVTASRLVEMAEEARR